MHYYQHHIGDFTKDTAFLTNEEIGIYLKLLWLYYDTEAPLFNDKQLLAMKSGSRNNLEALDRILTTYFVESPDGYFHHARCDKEIADYAGKVAVASKAGKASALKRKLKSNARSTPVELPLNDCGTGGQPTINHKPITINHKPKKQNLLSDKSDDFDRFWTAYPKKTGKKAAQSSWRKAKPPIDVVLQALAWQKDSRQWLEGFVPNPQTYLNQGRWDDEPEAVSEAPRGVPVRPWYISASGIEAKAKELGIDTTKTVMAIWKHDVYKQTGITEEMVRKATIDFQPTPQGARK